MRASRAWYDDVLALHGIPTHAAGDLWWTESDPPPWHSAVKTLRPGVSRDRVLRAVEPFDHCSVADSYADLDLAPAGFARLFTASWLHRDAAADDGLPDGWTVIDDPTDLATWSERHDYVGVLTPDVLTHPRFTVLARREGARTTGGAVLHVADDVLELSNAWADDGEEDVAAMVACAAHLHPGRPLVGYAHGAELDRWLTAGFRTTGEQVVWVR